MTSRRFSTIGAHDVSLATDAHPGEAFRVFAAGSLKAALSELALAFSPSAPSRPELVFGASGMLRDRLLAGEPADVFASANLDHPRAVAAAGGGTPPLPFARNHLCVLASPRVHATPETILDALVDPAWKLGTSTPRLDPSGDYAWTLFEKAESLLPGARSILAGKARKLAGGPATLRPPKERNVYAWIVESGAADVFVTYRTTAAAARRENPALRQIELPPALAVAADYAIMALTGAPPSADAFVRFVLAAEGRAILRRHGFDAPSPH
jgi:ABC-type molybdate transport system substrate-binding protein